MRMKRVTLQRPIEVEGLGLHSGKISKVVMLPSGGGDGIMIGAVKGQMPYPIGECDIFSPGRSTCVVLPNGHTIFTMEHLLAALYGMGVDDIIVLVDGDEIPIFDGSAGQWVKLLEETGLREREGTEKTIYSVCSPLCVEDESGDAWVACLPCENLKVTYVISFDDVSIGTQTFVAEVTRTRFVEEIAPSRTFVRLKDVEELKKEGLARGGSLHNALVFGNDGLLNDTQMRFANECARHKALDLLGDLALVGLPLQAHVIGYKAGHRLHLRLVDRLRRLCKGGWS